RERSRGPLHPRALRSAAAQLHDRAGRRGRGRRRQGSGMNLPTCPVRGGGPTVLMLHGIGGGHLAFAPQVETLASSGFRAVAWDMPGYGHSPPIEPYTFKGLAQRRIAL